MKLALSLLLCLSALPVRADVFDDASGLWGLVDDPELSCSRNPHRVSFFDGDARASFRWESEMVNYLGEVDQEGLYDVRGHGADYIVMALDGEQRTAPDGTPVVWIMRLIEGGDRYCWGRTDWLEDECIDRYVRCPAPPAIS